MILQPVGFHLKKLLSVYVRRMPEGVKDDLDTSYYMESHDIVTRDNKPVIGAGRPMTKQTFADLEKYFVARHRIAVAKQVDDLLYGENNMIYCDQRIGKKRFIWRVRSQRREIIFDKATKLPNGFIVVPDMIFMTVGRTLYVFIVDDANNLYDAPFYNIYDDGRVCLGTTDISGVIDAKTFKQFTDAWEQSFWSSKFSAHGISQRAETKALLKAYINNHEIIPLDKLAKRKETVQTIVLKQPEE
jgi:PRTRC genetic system protein B